MSARVVVATCTKLPEPDPDQPILQKALEDASLTPSLLAWDDASPDAARGFASADLVVIRSTWNYIARVDDFVGWARSTAQATRLFNPPDVVAWNTHKRYLADLEARGVDVVPTAHVAKGAKGARAALAALREAHGFADAPVVVKPAVSAGSYKTMRFAAGEDAAAQAFLDDLASERDAMVQKWMPSVDAYGERSLVWIDGEITHAIRKNPRFSGSNERVSSGEVPIQDDERAFAERALAAAVASAKSALLYGRVDMVRDGDRLRVMELELVEPSLFLVQRPSAAARLASAIASRV